MIFFGYKFYALQGSKHTNKLTGALVANIYHRDFLEDTTTAGPYVLGIFVGSVWRPLEDQSHQLDCQHARGVFFGGCKAGTTLKKRYSRTTGPDRPVDRLID